MPIPDPTALTTKQLHREVATLREILETRMDGSDKLIGQLQNHMGERGGAINEEVNHLKELNNEKFDSIDTRFKERDTRTDQSAKEIKSAVDAAFLSAEKVIGEANKAQSLAIGKSETATAKQIDQTGVTITNLITAFNDKIDDVKARVQNIENRITGMEATGKGKSDMWGYVVGGVSFVGMVIAIIVAVIAFGK